jgi:hypothetical protein
VEHCAVAEGERAGEATAEKRTACGEEVVLGRRGGDAHAGIALHLDPADHVHGIDEADLFAPCNRGDPLSI